jgi:hypothetical protein
LPQAGWQQEFPEHPQLILVQAALVPVSTPMWSKVATLCDSCLKFMS